MRRRLFNLAAAVSLVLCTATAVLWVRSYWVAEWVGWSTSKTELDPHIPGVEISLTISFRGLQSGGGGLALQSSRQRQIRTTPAVFARQWETVPDSADEFVWRRISRSLYPFTRDLRGPAGAGGFALIRRSSAPRGGLVVDEVTALVVPYWFLAFLTALLPTILLVRILRRRRRLTKGFCENCGYDLRATPGRCPECGAMPEPARPAA